MSYWKVFTQGSSWCKQWLGCINWLIIHAINRMTFYHTQLDQALPALPFKSQPDSICMVVTIIRPDGLSFSRAWNVDTNELRSKRSFASVSLADVACILSKYCTSQFILSVVKCIATSYIRCKYGQRLLRSSLGTRFNRLQLATVQRDTAKAP
jgi:hypothetical protein